MSQFLRNLWARTTQSAPVLEPRRPALFEPVAPWARPLRDIQEFSVESAAQAPLPPTSSVPMDEPHAADARGATRDRSVIGQSSDAMPMSTPTMSSVEMPSAEIAAIAVPTVVESGPAASRSVSSADPIHTATGQNAAVSLVDPDRATTPPARGELPATASAPSRSSLSPNSASDAPSSRPGPMASALPNAATAFEKLRQESETVGTLVPTAPRIAQAIQLAKVAQPQAALPFAGAGPNTKESVQITIGRVEVRAVTGGERPAARVAKSTAPRLTLNDYLRERNGGGR